ncbi:MAG: NUDIX hydrolase [Clostridium sp.]|uniref:NUDIX hydrolase n=1 Tax=Clostridium sp. TaxID=1506 RepID=UPI003F374702
MEEKWLNWAKRLQSIAQSGITYSKDKYDIERFEEIRNLSSEILKEYTDIPTEKVKDLFCNEKGYQTPKVDVRAAIFINNKILLVKESLDNKWALPGGWAEIDLSIKENAIKESFEEAGVNITPVKLIAVLDKNKHSSTLSPYSVYKVFVLCNFISGEFKENIETDDSSLFSIDNLPNLSLERNSYEQVKMCFDFNENQNLNTIFD